MSSRSFLVNALDVSKTQAEQLEVVLRDAERLRNELEEAWKIFRYSKDFIPIADFHRGRAKLKSALDQVRVMVGAVN